MMKCAAAIHREPETVRGVGQALAVRYGDGEDAHVDERQVAKRVALQFVCSRSRLVRPPQARVTAPWTSSRA